MRRSLLILSLILGVSTGVFAQVGPFSAQIQQLLNSANTWLGVQTFPGGINVTGTCTGCGGGGGTPGGSSGDLQYNNAGAFGGITPGTGILTALGVNVGSAGAPLLFDGAGGTPSSIVLTNATGTAASLTAGIASAVAVGGVSGLGTGIATWLATPSSANILAAVTDETGTGLLAFATSPTLSGAPLVSATLGSELAPALTAGNWTVGSGWESPIVGPGLIKNANGTGTQTPSAATTIVAGTTYKVVITLSAWSVGTARYSVGTVTGASTLGAATTYTDYITAADTGKLIITPTNTSRFTISAISIKAVTTTTGTLMVDGTLTVGGAGTWASSQQYTNNVFLKGATAAGITSRMLGVDTSNALNVGTPGAGETALQLLLHGNTSATGALRADIGGVVSFNQALTSVGNSTVMSAIGGANTAVTDTLNISDRGANNNTRLAIDASPLDASSDPLFFLRLTNRTTKTFTLAREGYALQYNNTTVAGTGLPFIPNVVSLTAQTASIGATNIQCTIAGSAGICPAGLYRVIVEMIVTTAGTSGTVATTIGWSDSAAARTASPATTLTFGTLVRSSGADYMTLDGVTNITYLTMVAAAVGSPQYALKITLERLQ